MAIPADVSQHSHAARIAQIDRRLGQFRRRMCETTTWRAIRTVTVSDENAAKLWIHAEVEAWAAVQDALEAGESLTPFLWDDAGAGSQE